MTTPETPAAPASPAPSSTAPSSTAVVTRPTVAPPADWSFPEAERHELPSGLTLLTYDVPGQYVLSIRLGLPVSLRDERRDREGVATIMARCLDEGTERHTAEEFARLLERKGVSFGAGISEAGLFLDVDVVTGNVEPALDLLRQILTEPAFPDAEVARQVRTRLAEIEQERSIAAHRAAMEFVATLYDASERASRPSGGTRETVRDIERDDVVAFHRDHVAASGATVVVAGDLTGLDIVAAVERSLGTWPAGEPRAPFLRNEAVLAPDRGRIVFVDRPGSVQSELILAAPGPDRSVPGGWAPHPVIGFVVGGSPNARIDAILREDKGFTYGIRAGFRPRSRGGVFVTSGSVRADSTAESLRLLVQILDGAGQGFTDAEVRSGVDFIGKTAPGRYATADSIADEAVSMALDGRTTQFTTDNLRDLATVDRARADAAWATFVERAGVGPLGAGWTIIVVGDAAEHVEAVEALGLGAVTVVKDS